MSAAYILVAVLLWLAFVLVMTGWIENRRDRDVISVCPKCKRRIAHWEYHRGRIGSAR